MVSETNDSCSKEGRKKGLTFVMMIFLISIIIAVIIGAFILYSGATESKKIFEFACEGYTSFIDTIYEQLKLPSPSSSCGSGF